MPHKESFADGNEYTQELSGKTIDEELIEASTTLLPRYQSMAAEMHKHAKNAVNVMVNMKELLMMYACAIKEIRTKFDVLNTEYNVRYQRNPINSISSRVKRTASLMEKLDRRGLPLTVQSIEENIFDVAGVRVICSFVDDVYTVANELTRQDDITLLERKDYIENPKPNGYRSLHLIVSVPVFFAQQTRHVKVEVQLRTIAMDLWASLEHQLKYKKDVPGQKEVVARLKACADTLADTDTEMLAIRQEIAKASGIPSEQDLLIEKLKKLDIPLY